jgi:hypothetical protein
VPGLGREAGKHAAELAARLRDEIAELKKELRQMVEAGAR